MRSAGRLNGQRVRSLREKRGMTQDELGQQIGTDGKQIIRYEKAKTDPSSHVVAALATALGTTSDFLMDLTDDDAPRLIFEELSAEERALIIALRNGQSTDAIQAFAVLSRER